MLHNFIILVLIHFKVEVLIVLCEVVSDKKDKAK